MGEVLDIEVSDPSAMKTPSRGRDRPPRFLRAMSEPPHLKEGGRRRELNRVIEENQLPLSDGDIFQDEPNRAVRFLLDTNAPKRS